MHNAQGFYKVPYQQQCIDDSEVLIFCVELLELSHLRHDLSQAEKKMIVVTS